MKDSRYFLLNVNIDEYMFEHAYSIPLEGGTHP